MSSVVVEAEVSAGVCATSTVRQRARETRSASQDASYCSWRGVDEVIEHWSRALRRPIRRV